MYLQLVCKRGKRKGVAWGVMGRGGGGRGVPSSVRSSTSRGGKGWHLKEALMKGEGKGTVVPTLFLRGNF